LDDGDEVLASEARIGAYRPIGSRHSLAGHLLGGSEWILEGKKIAGRIETMTNLSDQVAAAMSLPGDLPVFSVPVTLPGGSGAVAASKRLGTHGQFSRLEEQLVGQNVS
jgi:hypothetical protein